MTPRLCCVNFAVFLLAISNLMAQSTDATITGRITDLSKAVIVGAKVVVTNVDTGMQQSTYTARDGLYDIVSVTPGTYKVEVEKTGFKTIVRPNLVLHVQDVVSVNFDMAIGAVSESITVTGGTPIVNTESATVSTVVDRNFAENLPMNGRSFQTLIQLTPGVVLTTSNYQDGGQFSVNGQRASSNYWMVDGVGANIGIGVNSTTFAGNGLGGALGSFTAMGGTNSLVSVDAMQEFRIQTSTYAPEFGRTPGGQISIMTRSGTNRFHGTVFDYLRNDALDANDWFNGYTNNPPLAKAKERQNDFGGTISGPILKNRTFFFFSYEGLRLRLPQTTVTSVPDASFTPGGTTNSRQNAIPAVQPYLNAFPLPNRNSPEIFTLSPCDPATDPTCPSSGQKSTPTGTANLAASYSNPATLDAYSLRIDHRLGDNWTLFGRYNYSPSEIILRGGSGNSLNTVAPTRITTQTATFGATWLISPTMSNDLRFNYSRTTASGYEYMDGFGGAVPPTSLPFPSPFTSKDSIFNIAIASLQNGSLVAGQLEQNLQRQINLVNALSIQKGPHALKVGVDLRRLSPVVDPYRYLQFAYFADVPSFQNGTLLFSNVAATVSPTFLLRNLGAYVQDTWRIASRLTLTYGLRWDVDFVPKSTSGPSFSALTGFDLSTLSKLGVAQPGTSPYTSGYGNVAPRIGVAYQLRSTQDWQSVLRGGFGVFYDLASSEAGNQLPGGGYPFASSAFPTSVTFPLSPGMAAPLPITPPSTSNPGPLAGFDPRLQLPYTLQWNVALEQGLGKQQTISASYIGAAGQRLLQSVEVFSPTPSVTRAILVFNGGNSSYNALQLQFQRRLLRGLQVLTSYTWSHSIDTGSAGSVADHSNLSLPSAVETNRGPSDFDIRDALSAGVTYNIPDHKFGAVANAITRGWSLQSIVQVRSAPPVDISDSVLSQFNNGTFADIRPDLVQRQPLYIYRAQYPGGKAFNPNAFTNPPVDPITGNPVRQGDIPRNLLRGFGSAQWDFALHRDFRLRESVKLQFRGEMFNVLNHPNLGPPNGSFGAGGFGLSSQTLGQSLAGSSSLGAGGFSPLYQIGGPRSLQFALKLTF
jgi:Carboxypeptidase regulatory-like domain/TonB dependent receptor